MSKKQQEKRRKQRIASRAKQTPSDEKEKKLILEDITQSLSTDDVKTLCEDAVSLSYIEGDTTLGRVARNFITAFGQLKSQTERGTRATLVTAADLSPSSPPKSAKKSSA